MSLVVTLSVLLHKDVVHLGAMDDRAVSATMAEREVAAATMSVLRMRVISKELANEQTAAGVTRLLERATAQSTMLTSHLRAAALAAPGDQSAKLTGAVAQAGDLTNAIDKEGGSRRALLEIRDGSFWSLHDSLTTEINELRSDVVLENLRSEQIDLLTSCLAEYQAATDAIVYGTMSFLATGQAKFVAKTRDAVSTGRARMTEIKAVPLSEYVKGEVAQLEAKHLVFEDDADRLLASIATMDRDLADEVEQTYHHLLTSLGHTGTELAAAVTASYGEAADARSHLLSSNLYLSAAAVVLLALSTLALLHSIVPPIRTLTGLMQAMARGEVEARVPDHRRRDEIGAMMRALEMLRLSVRDAFVQSQMIGQLPIGVMTLDPASHFHLAYMNPKARSLLESSAPEIGQPVDMLHSRRIARLPEDLEHLPCVERVLVGDETFDLGISTIKNADGTHGSVMLTLTPRSEQVSLLNRFQSSIARIAEDLSQSSISVRESAASMRSAAIEGEHKTTAVAVATEQASRQMQSISSTVDQLVGSINETAAKIEMSFDMAKDAATQATLADGSIDRLGEAADHIGGIVRVIGEIAGRTKLLALNATIEAARAGESGRGFAVVAAEVKALASQTATATADVSRQAAAMQATSRQTMDVLQSVAGAIRQMSDIASGILLQIGEQHAALHAIVQAVKEVAVGTQDVTANVNGVQRIVSDTGGKAHDVLGATTALSQQAETLTVEAKVFLEAIQAVS